MVPCQGSAKWVSLYSRLVAPLVTPHELKPFGSIIIDYY